MSATRSTSIVDRIMPCAVVATEPPMTYGTFRVSRRSVTARVAEKAAGSSMSGVGGKRPVRSRGEVGTEDQVGQPPAQLRLCSVGITPPQPTQGQKTGRTVQLGHSLPLLPDRRVSPVGKENLLHLRRGVSIHLTPGWKPFLR